MPVEVSRTTQNKTIVLPSGGTVLVPVITKIRWYDSADRGQVLEWSINNNWDNPFTNKVSKRVTVEA